MRNVLHNISQNDFCINTSQLSRNSDTIFRESFPLGGFHGRLVVNCLALRKSRLLNAVWLVLGEIRTLCSTDRRKYFDEPSISQKLQTLKQQFDIQYGPQNFHLEVETVKV